MQPNPLNKKEWNYFNKCVVIPIFENSELSFDRTYNHISGWLANITELKSLIDKSYIDYNLPCTKFNKSIGKLTDEISKEIIEIDMPRDGRNKGEYEKKSLEYHERIWSLIKDEAAEALKEGD